MLYSILKIYNVCGGGRIVLEGFKSCGGCSRSSTLRLIEVKVLHKMFALYWRCLKISSFSKPGLLLLELWRHSKQWVCAKYTLILLQIVKKLCTYCGEKNTFYSCFFQKNYFPPSGIKSVFIWKKIYARSFCTYIIKISRIHLVK